MSIRSFGRTTVGPKHSSTVDESSVRAMEIAEQRDLLLQHDSCVYSGNPRVRQYNLDSF